MNNRLNFFVEKKLFANNNGLKYLLTYPSIELYRLLVDGQLYSPDDGATYKCGMKIEKGECGWLGYEAREPGCVAAFFRAFAYAIEHINEPINLEMIKKINYLCLSKEDGVPLSCTVTPGVVRSKHYYDSYFCIPIERASIAGIQELLEIMQNYKKYEIGFPSSKRKYKLGPIFGGRDPDSKTGFLITEKMQVDITCINAFSNLKVIAKKALDNCTQAKHANLFSYVAPCEYVVDNEMNCIIENLNRQLNAVTNTDNLLKVIVQNIKKFELLHPFGEANGRVFVNILVNIILMKYGQYPATYFDPNCFDMKSSEEIIEVIKQAMENSKLIIQNEPIFGFDTKSRMLKSDLEQQIQISEKLKMSVIKMLNEKPAVHLIGEI